MAARNLTVCVSFGVQDCRNDATEHHYFAHSRQGPVGALAHSVPLPVCDDCAVRSRKHDEVWKIRPDASIAVWYGRLARPIVGSEDSLMVECFMHAAMRLLRAA